MLLAPESMMAEFCGEVWVLRLTVFVAANACEGEEGELQLK